MMHETRYIATEVRVVREAGKAPAIEGYAAVFNSPSHDLGGFIERVKPGAFARGIKAKADVRALINHDPNKILGRTKSNTLQLQEDARGLKFRVTLADVSYARDLYASVQRGDLDQCSFSFTPVKQTWGEEQASDGSWRVTRELEDVDVFDVSVVTYPAYEETSAVARERWADCVPGEIRARVEAREAAAKAVKAPASVQEDLEMKSQLDALKRM